LIHTGSREFICKECGAQFKRRDHWKEHITRHNKEENLDCPTTVPDADLNMLNEMKAVNMAYEYDGKEDFDNSS
jgi:hypothetical protein